ncbi:glycosyltransferase [Vibrio tubiashii]|uniref:glycosyltransferase n=1 Tax=Vibrio tubiashii TaxID=29498 RepID=UPI00234E7388|nr:glycosyltransferase [Vibrio tubiashii]WCP67292.1 glycosyltransferase [Vibrio tubiashii]
MKILLMTTGLGLGGAERQVCDLADEFVRQGYRVIVISLNDRLEIRPNSKMVKLYTLSMQKSLLGFLSSLCRARQVVIDFQPDVVHSHMYHANIFARILRCIVSVPRLICTVHSSYEGGWFRGFIYRLTDRLASQNTIVSDYARHIFIESRAIPANRLITLSNGIDTTRFKFRPYIRSELRSKFGISDDDILLLSVGRLEEVKNYPELISAIDLLLNQERIASSIKLFVLGQGAMLGELERLVKEKALNERVQFIGARNNIEEWLSACDMLILPSLFEGFGLVALEALSCERPVVSTKNIGVKNEVERFGTISSTPYAPKLAESIRKAIQNIGCFNGQEARRLIVEKYSIQYVASRWIDVYLGAK